jgi:hypothetical protein
MPFDSLQLQVADVRRACLLLLLQVSLVLEYCDWGSLRTALDAGAFFAGDLLLCACGVTQFLAAEEQFSLSGFRCLC